MMQQLRIAHTENTAPKDCADDVLSAVPAVMRFIRTQMRSRRRQGLSVPQFRALVFANVHDRPSLSGLAEHIGLSPAAASRMVDVLVRRGLLKRATGLRDRRCIALSLTARGRAAYRHARRGTRLALSERLQSLGVLDRRRVSESMRTLERLFGAAISNTRVSS